MSDDFLTEKTRRETGAEARPPTDSAGHPPSVQPQIPDHQLLRCIGRGSYGEVWLARNIMGTYRAVKIVYRTTFGEDARPYEREFTGIQRFEPISRSHEGLVDVLQVGRNDAAGYFYYVMELADDASPHAAADVRRQTEPSATSENVVGFEDKKTGKQENEPPSSIANRQSEIANPDEYIPKTLAKEVHNRGRLPADECLHLSLTLTSALGHLHKHGLIHRDIKPSNIIFVNGIPKLADIGLVADVAEARSFVGTEGFIPPEGPGTARADLYSLGKVVYEICTGKDRQDFPELPTLMGDGEDRTELLELNEVIVKACEDEPAKRYQSAEEMHADLVFLQGGKSVKRLRSVERRLAVLTRIGAAAVVVVALSFGSITSMEDKSPLYPVVGRAAPAAGAHIILGQPNIFFLTVNAKDRIPWMDQAAVQTSLVTIWRDEATAWLTGYYLIMPDHLHLFCAPRDLRFGIDAWITF